MKELYISPIAEILCFMPVENLAYGQFDVYGNNYDATNDSTITVPDDESEEKD